MKVESLRFFASLKMNSLAVFVCCRGRSCTSPLFARCFVLGTHKGRPYKCGIVAVVFYVRESIQTAPLF